MDLDKYYNEDYDLNDPQLKKYKEQIDGIMN